MGTRLDALDARPVIASCFMSLIDTKRSILVMPSQCSGSA